jgi:hypothetical protein
MDGTMGVSLPVEQFPNFLSYFTFAPHLFFLTSFYPTSCLSSHLCTYQYQPGFCGSRDVQKGLLLEFVWHTKTSRLQKEYKARASGTDDKEAQGIEKKVKEKKKCQGGKPRFNTKSRNSQLARSYAFKQSPRIRSTYRTLEMIRHLADITVHARLCLRLLLTGKTSLLRLHTPHEIAKVVWLLLRLLLLLLLVKAVRPRLL